MPPKITAKAPHMAKVQLDNKEWVDVPKERMDSMHVGDTVEDLNGKTKVENTPVTESTPKETVVVKARPYRAGFNQELSDYDLAKDRQIEVCGLIQALLQSPLMNMIPDGIQPMQFVEQEMVKLLAIVKRLSGGPRV